MERKFLVEYAFRQPGMDLRGESLSLSDNEWVAIVTKSILATDEPTALRRAFSAFWYNGAVLFDNNRMYTLNMLVQATVSES
jgi:hypothetical protein